MLSAILSVKSSRALLRCAKTRIAGAQDTPSLVSQRPTSPGVLFHSRCIISSRHCNPNVDRNADKDASELCALGARQDRTTPPLFTSALLGAFSLALFQKVPESEASNKQPDEPLKSDGIPSDAVPMEDISFKRKFPEAFEKLANLLKERFSVAPGDREQRSVETSGHAARATPDGVAWPQSTAEVSSILSICNEHRVPVTPLAGGTSVEGHILAVHGGLILDMAEMDRIVALHLLDEDVVVQPGLGWMQLNDYLEPQGYFVSADPGPGACVGGMCGTGCSGTNAVRFGTMKDQVVSLTVVLADGTVITTRRRPRKSSAGYDLSRLFVGSEGTLGIVTEATLKIRPNPECTEVAYKQFPSIRDACSAAADILRSSVQMGAIELIDEPMIEAMNSYSGIRLPTSKPMLLLKFTGMREKVKAEVEVSL